MTKARFVAGLEDILDMEEAENELVRITKQRGVGSFDGYAPWRNN